MNPRVMVIGTSAGGVTALQTVFKNLPKTFLLPLVIVQHMPPRSQIEPKMVFGRTFPGTPIEACDKMSIRPGHAYFAPTDYHLLIEKDFTFSLSQDELVHFSRPSIDVLFESAARSVGPMAGGVLLTGANQDGAEGLKAIHEAGGETLVQSPRSAEFPMMPDAALNLFAHENVLSLEEIAERLAQISEKASL